MRFLGRAGAELGHNQGLGKLSCSKQSHREVEVLLGRQTAGLGLREQFITLLGDELGRFGRLGSR